MRVLTLLGAMLLVAAAAGCNDEAPRPARPVATTLAQARSDWHDAVAALKEANTAEFSWSSAIRSLIWSRAPRHCPSALRHSSAPK